MIEYVIWPTVLDPKGGHTDSGSIFSAKML